MYQKDLFVKKTIAEKLASYKQIDRNEISPLRLVQKDRKSFEVLPKNMAGVFLIEKLYPEYQAHKLRSCLRSNVIGIRSEVGSRKLC